MPERDCSLAHTDLNRLRMKNAIEQINVCIVVLVTQWKPVDDVSLCFFFFCFVPFVCVCYKNILYWFSKIVEMPLEKSERIDKHMKRTLQLPRSCQKQDSSKKLSKTTTTTKLLRLKKKWPKSVAWKFGFLINTSPTSWFAFHNESVWKIASKIELWCGYLELSVCYCSFQ